jgi:signal transduction histidine kinase
MRLAWVLLGILIATVLASEAIMRPSGPERTVLLVIYGGAGIVAAGAAVGIRWLVPRARSIRFAVFIMATASVAVAAVAVGLLSGFMFSSTHDLRLLTLALALGVSLALALSFSLARPLTADLVKLAGVAKRVGEGERVLDIDVDRSDEIGVVAESLEYMVSRLAEAEAVSESLSEGRRQFLASVSHDLRTPLASLTAAVEALADGIVSDKDRYYRVMGNDLALLGTLVDNLFLMTRLDAGDIVFELLPIDLAEIADEAVEAMSPLAARSSLSLELKTEGAVETVGGPQALSRVIRNLIDNGIRHAPPDTTVSVTVESGTSASVVVRDEGPGLAAEFVEDAFRSFSKADRARSRAGGGAGLAIAKRLVEGHGGPVWARPGPGGIVGFNLPVLEATNG